MTESQKYLLDNHINDIVLNAKEFPDNTEGNAKKWIYLSDVLTSFMKEQKEEIQNQAKKEVLNSYYVAIFERNMSVEEIMQSIEADRQFLDGEMILGEVNKILK